MKTVRIAIEKNSLRLLGFALICIVSMIVAKCTNSWAAVLLSISAVSGGYVCTSRTEENRFMFSVVTTCYLMMAIIAIIKHI
jgi:hypothetical protein